MEDYNKLQLYKKGLELTEEEIRLEEDFLKEHGRYSAIGSPEMIIKLKDTVAWYHETIAILEINLRDSLKDKYKNVETLDRLLEIDEKGVYWLYIVEPGKNPSLDECLGRNDDKYTLAIIPKELHALTHQEPPVKVKVVKEKAGPHKRRKVTTRIFIAEDF